MKDGSYALEAVKQVPCLYPGVTITSSSLHQDTAWIEVKITNAESIVWLEYACFAANIPSNLYAQTKPIPGESPEDSLGRLSWNYRFFGNPNLTNSEDLSPLQCFGDCLISFLYSLGRISENKNLSLRNMLYGNQ